LRALEAVHAGGIQGGVSLKLTQFGLDLSPAQCLANVDRLVARAAELGSFVRVDMESSDYTDRTLDLVRTLHARHGAAVGVVIQAYLRRSKDDIARLCAEKTGVRLCKGAYLEPATAAFPLKADVDRSYLELSRYLLTQAVEAGIHSGVYPAIATHDEAMIEQTKQFVDANAIARDRFEFQMLYGIRRDLQRRLVAEGYRLRLYVPFGKAWYPYYMRRLAERPANVFFIMRNLFRR
jgi:proline dehydrogenase